MSNDFLEKRISLTKESLHLIPDLIKYLYILYTNIPLYPAQSDMIKKPLEDLYGKFCDIFSQDKEVIFGNIKNVLVVNGQRLKEGELKRNLEEVFLKFLSDLRLETITFSQGLTKEDLNKFLIFLTKSLEEKNISEAFKAENISHISLAEVDYNAAFYHGGASSAKYAVKDLMLLDQLIGKISAIAQKENLLDKFESHSKEIADSIAELSENVVKNNPLLQAHQISEATMVLELIQRLGAQLIEQNPKEWDKCKSGLAKTLLDLKPELRNQIFFEATSEENTRLLRELLVNFPKETLIDIFVSSYKEEKFSDEQIRNAVKNLFIEKSENKEFTDSFESKLQKAGLSAKDLDWVLGKQSFGQLKLQAQIDKVLRASAEDYFLLRGEIDFKKFLEDILKNKKDDFLPVVQHLTGFYEKVVYDKKVALIKDYNDIFLMLPDQDYDLVETISEHIFSLMIQETDKALYKVLLDQLILLVEGCMNDEKFNLAGAVYKRLKDSMADSSQPGSRLLDLKELSERMFSAERVKFLVEEYFKKSSINIHSTDIINLFIIIGEPAAVALLEVALDDGSVSKSDYFDAYRRKRVFGSVLSKIMEKGGDEIVLRLLEERLKGQDLPYLRKCVELSGEIHNEKMAVLLGALINHQDVDLRKKVIFALGKIDGPQGVMILNGALRQNSGDVLLDIIAVLGRIGNDSSAEALKTISDKEIQQEINRSVNLIERRMKNPTQV